MYWKRLLIIMLCALVPAAANAQGFRIAGSVLDTTGQGIANVGILLMRDSILVTTSFTGADGHFVLENVSSGSYTVQVRSLGYAPAVSPLFDVTGDKQIPVIVLLPSNALNEVQVKAAQPFIELQHDKVVVNVDNSIFNAGASVLEVLARSPGVTIDANDNIRLKGKGSVNIMIDGKPTTLSGNTLANMLKSMPSNSIDRIELISNPSAKLAGA